MNSTLRVIIVVFIFTIVAIACDKDEPAPFNPIEEIDYTKMFTTEKLGDISAYLPLFDTKYGQVADVNGNLFSQWKAVPNLLGTAAIGIQWGVPGSAHEDFREQMGTEVWQVKYDCASGYNYAWLNGYGDDDGNVLWAINLTKAIFINENTKDTFDITNGGTCDSGGGHPYMLFDLYDEPYTIQIWHDIKNSEGTIVKRVFWQHTVTPFVEVINPVWAEESSNTRMTIHQAESWWDSDGGWQGNATGDMQSANCTIEHFSDEQKENYQEPTGENVIYAHDQWWAKGVEGDESGWYAWKLLDRNNGHVGYLKYGWKY